MKLRRQSLFVFFAGQFLGIAIYHGFLAFKDYEPVSRTFLDEQQLRVDELVRENAELTDELFRPRAESGIVLNGGEMPYDGTADAAILISNAREQARTESKYLMVTFGANWCLDCRTLHYHLTNEPVAGYARGVFDFVNVDVGKLNQNRDVAESLGVSLARGIPVAVIFDRDGSLLGTTNNGELEPARYYSSQQILKFVRDIAERQRVIAPDSVE